ncbi:MAG: hypothetical protein HY900_31390, partial [Deltaproteobacteria bacterium]|nr:hypothetical protein [Deltaproteobacteria bacterium]
RQLEESEETVPDGFLESVMAALPESPEPHRFAWLRALWPSRWLWAPPALAGAIAAVLLLVGAPRFWNPHSRDLVPVTFEVHAPEAQRVEVVGNFNEWKRGEILLEGPSATGDWKATVRLPSGRYEYMFLVDGRDWVADPKAPRRPDGFGGENALLQV